MPESAPDPRVYFAAERTLLAWLRTGIAVMAFGFVVARVGLLLPLLQHTGAAAATRGVSAYLGTLLVGLGVVATAGGAMQYRGFLRSLSPADRPQSSSAVLVLGLSWALAVLGAVLGVLLLL